ncbi:unnamed protein product [Arctogadus glacialis]
MSSTRYRSVVWESPELVAYLHPRPWTPGSVILEQRATGSGEASIFQLGEPEYLSMLLGARAVGALLCDRLGRPTDNRSLPQEPIWLVRDISCYFISFEQN